MKYKTKNHRKKCDIKQKYVVFLLAYDILYIQECFTETLMNFTRTAKVFVNRRWIYVWRCAYVPFCHSKLI